MSDKVSQPIHNRLIDAARLGLITIAWLAALITVMFGAAVRSLTEIGIYCFILFAICTLPRLRRDSLIILTVLAVLMTFALMAVIAFECRYPMTAEVRAAVAGKGTPHSGVAAEQPIGHAAAWPPLLWLWP